MKHPSPSIGFVYISNLTVEMKREIIAELDYVKTRMQNNDAYSPYICDCITEYAPMNDHDASRIIKNWIHKQLEKKRDLVCWNNTNLDWMCYRIENRSEVARLTRIQWLEVMIDKVISTMPFFIRDCNGKIVGNPNGYRTFKGANQQQNQKGSPAYNAIWKAYYEAEKAYIKGSNAPAMVSSIKQG